MTFDPIPASIPIHISDSDLPFAAAIPIPRSGSHFGYHSRPHSHSSQQRFSQLLAASRFASALRCFIKKAVLDHRQSLSYTTLSEILWIQTLPRYTLVLLKNSNTALVDFSLHSQLTGATLSESSLSPFATALVYSSAFSLLGIPWWAGTHQTVISLSLDITLLQPSMQLCPMPVPIL